VKQRYLNVLTLLWKVLRAKDCTNNHFTDKIVGIDDEIFNIIFYVFKPLSLHCFKKDRLNRPIVSNREESAKSESLFAPGLGEGKRLLRELDGTIDETAFDKLRHWCSFGRSEFAGGRGRNATFGWGNLKWTHDGTLVIVVRVQAYLWWTNRKRPSVRMWYDTITYRPCLDHESESDEEDNSFPGLTYNEGSYSEDFLRRVFQQIPHWYDDARAEGLPFEYYPPAGGPTGLAYDESSSPLARHDEPEVDAEVRSVSSDPGSPPAAAPLQHPLQHEYAAVAREYAAESSTAIANPPAGYARIIATPAGTATAIPTSNPPSL